MTLHFGLRTESSTQFAFLNFSLGADPSSTPNIFLDLALKQTKAKVNKWEVIKLKSFCPSKKPSTKQKENLLKGEEIFTNNISNKGWNIQIHKLLMHLNSKKPNNLI